MIKTIIRKGSYQDSVVLMLLTNKISSMPGIHKVSIMMATPANKDLFKASGLETPQLLEAQSNDMAIVVDVESEELIEQVLKETEEFLSNQSKSSAGNEETQAVSSWEQALKRMPDANLAVLSIPGMYAAAEADRALDENLNVFIFSDNVSKKDEIYLKQKAHGKGLLVMGPDCGTGIINGVPIAFTNHVRMGKIGVIGASGTGIQEVTSIIDQLGEGVANAIGTGGRDLSAEVGGITMLDAIDAMEKDPNVEVVVILSKPPAKEVRDVIVKRLWDYEKPVVTLFLGERPEIHEENFYHAYTLDEAARIAVSLVRKEEIVRDTWKPETEEGFKKEDRKTIKGYYSGGTLGAEAVMLIKDTVGITGAGGKKEGCLLNAQGFTVIDLGDDIYTVGKPHPMIDPANRGVCMKQALEDEQTGVILFDLVLGYGSHEDMAGALLPGIMEMMDQVKKQGRKVYFVAAICGTRDDKQNYDLQKKKLEDAGVIVCSSNKRAAETALALIGYAYEEKEKTILPREKEKGKTEKEHAVSEQMMELLSQKPRIINIGLRSFTDVLEKFSCRAVQFQWTPPAGGDLELMKVLQYLRGSDSANQEVIQKVILSSPVLLDVVPAKTVIKELNQGKTLLHAGPPILWENMTSPMKGSCIGAVLFEKWAATKEEAEALLNRGEVDFIPCHHVDAVGPMGGITSANMPVFVVENTADGNRAYCSMNEGTGKVLRFGAYSGEVILRLGWMRDVLGPVLSLALREFENGLALNPMIAKAIAMGDEFHQRNIAASLLFLKEMSPVITGLSIEEEKKKEVIRFLADTDQFFLNIMMAAAKAVMDGARMITEGTIVTAMCRNGENFGIRISGMKDEWFTAPVNTPQGLYFTGYSGEDASPDIGDSAITETFGVGGMAMIAAPAVTRFVGTGGFQDALRISNEMLEIVIGQNPNFAIPTWNFQGICLGIDARKVVEKGITPVINTGIAHKEAGVGQIGAGTVHPPIECFQKAVRAYAKKLGYKG